ncbi:UPF0489 family protein [Planktothrix sp. FACHB-1355]|uniref:UPF0489 family protein n=1 Tax=Planktothrix sp. FACHB-1355 TaxID=2692854 RepID=UPI00168B7B1F|nr:UPF0489 family protein [Planktothrix sp. FACHB-1355]MBD3557534.1 UPF0489 family protein [Planktothrix sp. FACHB-1355]MBD3885892.1 UPF0489 family protein [Phormidium tenue FACHB-886]
MKDIKIQSVCGKNVYIFEDHATALIPWAACRRKLEGAPNLITLDFHTDVMTAFNAHECSWKFDNPNKPSGETAEYLCSEIDYRDPVSVERAVEKLRNDEQIDAAIKAGIIDYAFVISYDGRNRSDLIESAPRKRYEVERGEMQPNGMITLRLKEVDEPIEEHVADAASDVPEDKIFIIDWEVGFKYPKVEITEEDTRRHSDLAIESDYLKAKLEVADRMCRSVGQTNICTEKYILDIDLDYFRTAKAIEPADTRTFYELIRNAEAITIALEPKFVALERLTGEDITSDFLLLRLLNHIKCALK